MPQKFINQFCFLFLISTVMISCASNQYNVSDSKLVEKNVDDVEDEKQVKTQEETDIVKIRIETTLGNIEADLFKAEAPKTVENFVTLSKKGFYDGIVFHRVIPGFMIQTGDPTGTGMGGPDYTFEDEFSPNLRHDKAGILSMANSGPNTNGSQFFITEGPTPHLDNRHSVFGQVTGGMDVVEKIANADRDGRDKPLEDIKMNKVVIVEE